MDAWTITAIVLGALIVPVGLFVAFLIVQIYRTMGRL